MDDLIPTRPTPNAMAAATVAPGPAPDLDRTVIDARALPAPLPHTGEQAGMELNRGLLITDHAPDLQGGTEVAAPEDVSTLIIEKCPHTK